MAALLRIEKRRQMKSFCESLQRAENLFNLKRHEEGKERKMEHVTASSGMFEQKSNERKIVSH
jgi:hypothetical protein